MQKDLFQHLLLHYSNAHGLQKDKNPSAQVYPVEALELLHGQGRARNYAEADIQAC